MQESKEPEKVRKVDEGKCWKHRRRPKIVQYRSSTNEQINLHRKSTRKKSETMDERLLNDLLECSVCLERLDTSSKVLPCQHTFCRKCLEVSFGTFQNSTIFAVVGRQKRVRACVYFVPVGLIYDAGICAL